MLRFKEEHILEIGKIAGLFGPSVLTIETNVRGIDSEGWYHSVACILVPVISGSKEHCHNDLEKDNVRKKITASLNLGAIELAVSEYLTQLGCREVYAERYIPEYSVARRALFYGTEIKVRIK